MAEGKSTIWRKETRINSESSSIELHLPEKTEKRGISGYYLRELEMEFLKTADWEVKENANANLAYGSYIGFLLNKILKTPETMYSYLPRDAVDDHFDGAIHIHKLPNSLYIPYCAGWSLPKILKKGLITRTMISNPAKHLDTAISHLVNFFFLSAQEWTGAIAVTGFDLYLAPFIGVDRLGIDQVRQALQRLVFELNYPSRMGYQSPFTNVTVILDTVNDYMNEDAIVGGKKVGRVYDYFDEALTLNRELFKLYLKGDAVGQPFTFPIVTVMLTKNFDWNGSKWDDLTDLFFEVLSKKGAFYIMNGYSTDVSALYAMCLHPTENILIKNDNTIKLLKVSELEKYIGEPEGNGWFKLKKKFLVPAFNKETYRLEWTPVKRILKIKSDKVTIVKTKDGRSIKVTPKHPIVVYTQDGFKIKFAEDVLPGDLVPIVKNGLEVLKKEYIFVSGLGRIDENFAYILGLFIAEGNYLRLTRDDSRKYDTKHLVNGFYYKGLQFSLNKQEQNLIEKIRKFFKERYGKDIILREDPRFPNNVYVYVYHHNLATNLLRNGVKNKPKNSGIPWFIWNSPPSVIKAFIKGFFDGDGYKRGLELHINDPDLAKELALLTQLIGMNTTIRIREKSQVIRFVHIFGRGGKELMHVKDTLFERVPYFLVKKRKGMNYHKGMYSISVIKKFDAWTPEARKIYQGDIALIPIESVDTVKLQGELEFYDIELEAHHLFVHSLGTITHNCCRLTIDVSKVSAKNGLGFKFSKSAIKEDSEEVFETLKKSERIHGIWAMPDATGSIGVVTLNLPRLAIEANGDESEFYDKLYDKLKTARQVLLWWRKRYDKTLEAGLMPLTKTYLGHFKGHFNTFGIIGLPETAVNLVGDPNLWHDSNEAERGIKLMKRIVSMVRKVAEEYEDRDNYLYNVEEIPGESAAYRLARKDYIRFLDLIKAKKAYIPIYLGKPFYSNSIVPYYVDVPISKRVAWEGEVQQEFTGGVMAHLFMHEAMDPKALKKLIYNIATKTKVVYFSITPSITVCNNCGWKGVGVYSRCPKCGSDKVDVWSRIVGYYRPVRTWNEGKKAEFYFRVHYGKDKRIRPIDV
ncbi:MAG: anaerobic ribonucleoside-triphosphate reductase [Candidatus Njordarchaeia archaeon]|nr:hypothetical protein [Candidatus Korarchaeota archaeon]